MMFRLSISVDVSDDIILRNFQVERGVVIEKLEEVERLVRTLRSDNKRRGESRVGTSLRAVIDWELSTDGDLTARQAEDDQVEALRQLRTLVNRVRGLKSGERLRETIAV